MAYFNGFQLVVLFAVFPFLIGWLQKAHFFGATALTWVAIVAYVVEFIFATVVAGDAIKRG